MPTARMTTSRLAVVPTDLQDRAMPVPGHVKIDGDHLMWSRGRRDDWEDGERAVGALPAFLALAAGTDVMVRDFVRRYGPLGLATDGHPLTLTGQMPPAVEDDGGQVWYVESAAHYRFLSQHAADMIDLGLALRKAKVQVDPGDVLTREGERPATPVVYEWLGLGAIVRGLAGKSLAAQRQWLADRLSVTWVHYGNLSPVVTWTGQGFGTVLGLGSWVSEWTHGSTYAVLALSIASTVTGTPSTPTCAWPGCGRRLPEPDGPGRPVLYCAAHRQEAERKRKADWARRQRSSFRPHLTPVLTPEPRGIEGI